MKLKRVVLCGFLAAIIYLQQLILSGLPNIELCTLLIMLFTVTFPKETPWVVAVFIFLEGITWGFGIWWVGYCYIWPILMGIAWICRENGDLLFWTVIAGAFGLGFGALNALPYFFTGGWTAAFSYWIAGIPFDLAHCFGNVVSVLLLWKPFLAVLTRLKKQFK
ncbi:MAG: hypothetical protein IKM31_10600, partial [Oscillospiraceae bacterium]|nr:hypothetical protein [Oscillospiraceae bacterium]